MTEIVVILIFVLAILYSSVGHGGASGYLAIMAIVGVSPELMRPSALVLNLFVSSIAFYSFYRNGHFRSKLFIPFIITSIPAAFLGGSISIEPRLYKIILGSFLLIAVFRLIFRSHLETRSKFEFRWWIALVVGLVIGFMSGLIGIGGGIILSPIILLLGWGNVKQTAAVSAAFIFVNSLSGLSGQIVSGVHFTNGLLAMVIAGVLGGLLGSYLGSARATTQVLRLTLSAVLVLASFKLIFI